MSTHISDFYRGDTVTFNLTLTKDSLALDLTGAVITFTMKSGYDDADADAALQATSVLNADPTTGLATITLTAANTDSLLGKYYYDFQLVEADGTVTTLEADRVEVRRDITRSIS